MESLYKGCLSGVGKARCIVMELLVKQPWPGLSPGLSEVCPQGFCLVNVFVISFSHVEYLSQVESAERRECEERRAWEECQKVQEEAKSMATAATVTGGLLEILQKLGRPDEMSLYYCGGVELLSHAITDCECRSYLSSPLLSSLLFSSSFLLLLLLLSDEGESQPQ